MNPYDKSDLTPIPLRPLRDWVKSYTSNVTTMKPRGREVQEAKYMLSQLDILRNSIVESMAIAKSKEQRPENTL